MGTALASVPEFSADRIASLTELSVRSSSPRCTALLLNYRKTRFPDLPEPGFSLDR